MVKKQNLAKILAKSTANAVIAGSLMGTSVMAGENSQLSSYLSQPNVKNEVVLNNKSNLYASNKTYKSIDSKNNVVKYKAPPAIKKENLFGWSDTTWAIVGTVVVGGLIYAASKGHHHSSVSATSGGSSGGGSSGGGTSGGSG